MLLFPCRHPKVTVSLPVCRHCSLKRASLPLTSSRAVPRYSRRLGRFRRNCTSEWIIIEWEFVVPFNGFYFIPFRKLEKLSRLSVRGHPLSPVKHLYLREHLSRSAEYEQLDRVVKECQSQGLCLVMAQYLEDKEKKCPRPSIRITANRLLNSNDLEKAVKTIDKVTGQVV